jgi:hypothetical protein
MGRSGSTSVNAGGRRLRSSSGGGLITSPAAGIRSILPDLDRLVMGRRGGVVGHEGPGDADGCPERDLLDK